MWNVFFSFMVEVDIFGDASRKMCGLLWRWFLPPRTTLGKSEGRKKKKITDISPISSIHAGKSCQQEQGHSFKLMSASSDRFWMAEWRCSGRNKALCHRASLLSVIDHRQNQQLSFVKDSFLPPHFLFTLSLPLSLSHKDPCFWPPEKDLQPGKEIWPLAPPLTPRLGFAHCRSQQTHLTSGSSFQATWMLEPKVL